MNNDSMVWVGTAVCLTYGEPCRYSSLYDLFWGWVAGILIVVNKCLLDPGREDVSDAEYLHLIAAYTIEIVL